MTTIRFSRPLSEGETMEIASPDRPTVSVTGPPPSTGSLTQVGTVTLSSHRPSDGTFDYGTAPAGFIFTATAEGFESSDPTFQEWKDLHYTWRFGTPEALITRGRRDMPWERAFYVDGALRVVRGSDVFDSAGNYIEPATKAEDGDFPDIPGWKIDNSAGTRTITWAGYWADIGYGPWVSKVFAPEHIDFGGAAHKDLTVTCEVRAEAAAEPLLTEQMTVRIRNPEAVFDNGALGATILIHPTAPTGTPSDSRWEPGTYPNAYLVNSLLDAMAIVDANGSSTWACRFLFARGQAHDIAAQGTAAGQIDWIGIQWRVGVWQAGVYGDGAAPTFTGAPLEMRWAPYDEASEGCFWGLDYIGPFDATAPNIARPGNGLEFGKSQARAGLYKTMWDCEVSGWNVNISGTEYSEGRGFTNTVIGNTFSGDWSNYGIFMHNGTTNFGMQGVFLEQPYGTVIEAGRDEDPVTGADHGPLRCNSPEGTAAFSFVSIRSLNSWAGPLQPCDRYCIKPISAGIQINWDRVRFEGGRGIFRPASGASGGLGVGEQYHPVKALYDKVYHVNYLYENAIIGIAGPVVRNSIIVYPDSNSWNELDAFVWGSVADPSTDPDYHSSQLEHGVEIYSDTFVDLRARSVSGWTSGGIDPTNFDMWGWSVLENNILHAPNRPDLSADLGLDSTVLTEVDFPGFQTGSSLDTSFAIPSAEGVGATYAPATTIAASGKTAIDDFFGRLRTGTPSQGAVEP